MYRRRVFNSIRVCLTACVLFAGAFSRPGGLLAADTMHTLAPASTFAERPISIEPQRDVHVTREELQKLFGDEKIIEFENILKRPIKSGPYTHFSRLIRVTTDKGKYVIKNIAADPMKTRAVVEGVLRLESVPGIPITKLKRFPSLGGDEVNQRIIEKNGFYHVVMDYFVPMEAQSQRQTYGKLRSVGDLLALIDKAWGTIVEDDPGISKVVMQQPVSRSLSAERKKLYADMKKALQDKPAGELSFQERFYLEQIPFVEKAIAYVEAHKEAWDKLKKRLLYFDLNVSNAAFSPTDAIEGMYDFDSVRIGPRIMEFKNALITFGKDSTFLFDENGLIETLRAFNKNGSVDPLSDEELALLPCVFLGAYADVFYDYFFGKWNVFSADNVSMLKDAMYSLGNLKRSVELFCDPGNNAAFAEKVNKNYAKAATGTITYKPERTLLYVAPTQTGKERGEISVKQFYLYDVQFDRQTGDRIQQYVDRENARAQYEGVTPEGWRAKKRDDRISMMRGGEGPAQLVLLSEDEIRNIIDDMESQGEDYRGIEVGDNAYALLPDAPGRKGAEWLKSMPDSSLVRVSIAGLERIKINGKYLFILMDSLCEEGRLRYIPIGGALKIKEPIRPELGQLGVVDYENPEMGDMRFKMPKGSIDKLLSIISRAESTHVETPAEVISRKTKMELTGRQDGASVFIDAEFPTTLIELPVQFDVDTLIAELVRNASIREGIAEGSPAYQDMIRLTTVALESAYHLQKYMLGKKVLYKEQKAENDYVTEADILLNNYINSRLKSLNVTVPVLSEESEHDQDLIKSGSYVAVDPIDGTSNFIRTFNREFNLKALDHTTLISLVNGSRLSGYASTITRASLTLPSITGAQNSRATSSWGR